jgi:ERF superfamily
MKELYSSLLKARQSFGKIIKSKINPHYKNRYADLDSILEAVEPSLHSNGLFIVQSIEGFTLHTKVIHAETAQELVSSYPLPEGLDSQKFGSAITYARRYDLCALLSITADSDDDGAGAVSKTTGFNNENQAPSRTQYSGTKPSRQASPSAIDDF